MTSIMKPHISPIEKAANGSHPRPADKAQINTVLEVSIVDLCEAEAFLVIAIPNTLKNAIDTIIPKEHNRIPVC